MLVLLETATGIAIFKVNNEAKLKEINKLYQYFESTEGALEIVTPKSFEKFSTRMEALIMTQAAIEGKISRPMKKSIIKHVAKDPDGTLLVGDDKLALAVTNTFGVPCESTTVATELIRCIKLQLNSLLKNKPQIEAEKLFKEPKKRIEALPAEASDVNVIKAHNMLNTMLKDINIYERQIRESYGVHFPELQRILPKMDNYVNFVSVVGHRFNICAAYLSSLMLCESVEEKLKKSALLSVGRNLKPGEMQKIQALCRNVLSMYGDEEYLTAYLQSKMMELAPNITAVVGVETGAKFIARAGSLLNLALRPSSNLQLLGAEKSLYRAKRNQTNTPNHGWILHTDMLEKTDQVNKKKVSRMVAAKFALAARTDAFSGEKSPSVGIQQKMKLQSRINALAQKSHKMKDEIVVTPTPTKSTESETVSSSTPDSTMTKCIPKVVHSTRDGAGDCKSILKKNPNDNAQSPSGDRIKRKVTFNLNK